MRPDRGPRPPFERAAHQRLGDKVWGRRNGRRLGEDRGRSARAKLGWVSGQSASRRRHRREGDGWGVEDERVEP